MDISGFLILVTAVATGWAIWRSHSERGWRSAAEASGTQAEAWKGEHEAQTERANRLHHQLIETNAQVITLLAERDALREKTDLSAVLEQNQTFHIELVETMRELAKATTQQQAETARVVRGMAEGSDATSREVMVLVKQTASTLRAVAKHLNVPNVPNGT